MADMTKEQAFQAAWEKALSRFSLTARTRLGDAFSEGSENYEKVRQTTFRSKRWTAGRSLEDDVHVVIAELTSAIAKNLDGQPVDLPECLGFCAVPGQALYAIRLGPGYGPEQVLREVGGWSTAGEVEAIITVVRMKDGATQVRWSSGSSDLTLALIDLLQAAARKSIWGV